ncbi:MAG: hypothetical protein C5B54_10245 [Acidobacteria bacterium]|nr:MAG: hypothetical protein C5B54_10245 [Acidobacteriota bacterium]
MNSIKQYRPTFVESDEELKRVEFNSLDELLAIPFVKNFSEGKYAGPLFKRFTISDHKILMAEYKSGEYYVVGFLKEPVDLPKWEPRDGTKYGWNNTVGHE